MSCANIRFVVAIVSSLETARVQDDQDDRKWDESKLSSVPFHNVFIILWWLSMDCL